MSTPSPLRVLFVALAVLFAVRSRAVAATTIEAAPRQVELDRGARATLRITAPDPPVVVVSVGHVEDLKALGHGSYEATYVPPAESYPQIAIIVASTSRTFAWLALPLAGTGEVTVNARPNEMASLTIGKSRFGPVRADAAGRARIRVVVPPGVKEAISGSKRVPLNTPDIPHVYATVDRSTVTADAAAVVLVRAFAVTAEGRPRRGAELIVKPSAGRVSAAREVEPGVLDYTWSIPPGAAGPVTVSATLKDQPRLASTATVVREGTIARRIRIEVDRPRLVAGDDPVDVTLSVQDGAGNPVADTVPRVTTRSGTLLGLTRGAPGRWIARVTVPERIEGDANIEIAVAAGEAQAWHSIPIVPGPAANVTIEPATIDATAGGTFTFAVATVDRFGNPTDAAPPNAAAQVGSVEGPEKKGPGLYRVTYRPPPDPTTARDEVRFRSGTIERISRVTLHAPRPSVLQVTPKGGVVRRSGSFGPVAGAEVSAWTTLGDQQVGLAFEGSWFSFSSKAAVADAGLSLEGKQTYLAFTLSPSWRVPLGGSAVLSASLGGGVVRVASSAKLTGQPSLDESRWVGAGTAAVSIGARMWGGLPFLELRGTWVQNPALDGLSGAFTPVFLMAGYRFDAF